MVSEKEKRLRKFVVDQLRHESDISTLTLGILKKRYLAHVKCESLSPEAKKFMKQVVEEELLNMQENATSESDSEVEMPQSKRKRESEQEEVESEEEKESRSKKSRARVSSSSSDSEDEEERKTSPKPAKSQDAKKEVRTDGNTEQQTTSEDDSSDEEMKKSEQSESENNESPEKIVEKKPNTPKAEERSPKTSDEECESRSDGKSEQRDEVDDGKSSGNENEVAVEKKNNNSDSDSSSVPSPDVENKGEAEDSKSQKKKKKVKNDQSSQKNDDKAVVRLKRYISLCGVRRNYKKLLDSCRSTGSRVAALKKELEDLGVHGNPTIEKCKKVRMKREQAQELAELDVGNIINTEGRRTRRGMSTRLDQQDPPSSTYKRALNSGSDTEEENNPDKERRKISQWSNLRGIISDDADSD